MTTVGASDVPLTSYLTASLRIWLRSPLLRMLIAVIVFMVATCGLQFTTGRHGWDDALGFLNLWVVAAGPLFVALTVGYLAHIDRTDRSGGVELRNVRPRHRLVGRSFVAVIFSTLLQFGATAVWFALSYLAVDGASVSSALVIAVSLSVSYVWYCVLLAFVSTFAPVLGPAVVGLGTVVTGILASESAHWYLVPPAWMLRSTLGAIGTHTNGTSLAGDALPAGPVPFVGSMLLAAVLVVVAAPFTSTGQRALGRSESGRAAGPLSWALRRVNGTTGAVLSMIRGGTIPLLTVASVAFVALTLRWRPMSDSAEIFGLMVLPMGCTVLSALWVARVRNASRALACRPPVPESIGIRLVVSMNVVVVLVATAIGVVFAAAGGSAGSVVTQVVVFSAVGSALLGLLAMVAVLLGTVATVALGVIGTIFGALVGGTDLYSSVGAVIPFAWAAHPSDANLLVLMPASLVLAAITSTVAARRLYPARRR